MAGPDESRRQVLDFLQELGVDPNLIHETNWSWAPAVIWPFPNPQKKDDFDTLRWEALRYTGDALFGAAQFGYAPPKNSTAIQRLALALIRTALDIAPSAILVGLPLVLMLGPHIAVRALQSLCVVMAGLVALSVAVQRHGGLLQGLRAILLVASWPLLSLITMPAGIPWFFVLPLFVPGALVISLAYTMPLQWLRLLNGRQDTAALVGLLAAYLLTALMFYFLAWLGAAIVKTFRNVVEPYLKVLADILRYLGHSEYRKALQDMVYRDLLALQGKGVGRIFILAHSLGTVIATDVLRWNDLPRETRIVLVTAGSPLLRFFFRFFRTSYPRPSVLHEELRALHPNLIWCHVFRPRDPVGTSLGLSSKCEGPTRRSDLKGFSAHADYWGADDVHEKVLELLATRNATGALVSQGNALSNQCRDIPGTDNWSPSSRLAGARRAAYLRLAICGLVVGVMAAGVVLRERQLHRASQVLSDLRVHGERVNAKLLRTMELVIGDRTPQEVPEFTLLLPEQSGRYRAEKLGFLAFDLISERRLMGLFGSGVGPDVACRDPVTERAGRCVDVQLVRSKGPGHEFTILGAEMAMERGTLAQSFALGGWILLEAAGACAFLGFWNWRLNEPFAAMCGVAPEQSVRVFPHVTKEAYSAAAATIASVGALVLAAANLIF